MAIVMHLDVMLARRKVKSRELAAYVGITEQNLSLLKSGRIKGIRFSTLEKICERLACQPGDIMEWVADEGRDHGHGHGAGDEGATGTDF